jgi:sugar/nucleoside kinase (ribokinase family)
MEKNFDVIGIGNALMDILIQADDSHLAELKLKKGTFNLLSKEKVDEMLKKLGHKVTKKVPAGGTTNTLMGISNLGGRCVLCGKVGNDAHGSLYAEMMKKESIKPNLARCSEHSTGRVLNLITPDAERTFAVNLGAAVNLQKHEIIDDDIKQSRILYLTGYEFESAKEAVLHAIAVAEANDVKIALDLADPELVKRNLAGIKELMKSADILFMNESEAKALTGLDAAEAAKEVGKQSGIVIVKIGSKGSFVHNKGKTLKIEPYLQKAIDTTGAGDLYAAGFLYGFVNGKELALCGKYGSYMASKIVQVIGAKLEGSAKEEIDSLR